VTTNPADFGTDERLDCRAVTARTSAIGGTGLFAAIDFAKGEIVCGYTGRPVSEAERATMMEAADARRQYIIRCGDGFIVPDDITVLGGHLANHSCDPNADFKTYAGRPNTCVLHARRRIRAGDEICTYYGWVSTNRSACRCGARRCTGSIGLPLLVSDSGELGYSDDDVIELLRVGYVNRNEACRQCLHRLRDLGPALASDEAWTAQVEEWLRAAFGRGWRKSQAFRWFFS